MKDTYIKIKVEVGHNDGWGYEIDKDEFTYRLKYFEFDRGKKEYLDFDGISSSLLKDVIKALELIDQVKNE